MVNESELCFNSTFVLSWYHCYVLANVRHSKKNKVGCIITIHLAHSFEKTTFKKRWKKNNPRTQQKDSQVPLIRFPWRYTNVTNCTFKQPTKINAYIPRPLVPHLPHNSVCFDPYPGFWLPSNLENFIQIYKSVSTPKPIDTHGALSLCWHCVTVAEALSCLKEKGVAAFPLLLNLKASISKIEGTEKSRGVKERKRVTYLSHSRRDPFFLRLFIVCGEGPVQVHIVMVMTFPQLAPRRSWAASCGSQLPHCSCQLASCPSVSGAPLRVSFARRFWQTCVHRTHRRRVSHPCACECVWSDGRSCWRSACIFGTGRVCDPCGCGGDAWARLSARSVCHSSLPDRRAAARGPGFCWDGWGTSVVGWVLGWVSVVGGGAEVGAAARRWNLGEFAACLWMLWWSPEAWWVEGWLGWGPWSERACAPSRRPPLDGGKGCSRGSWRKDCHPWRLLMWSDSHCQGRLEGCWWQGCGERRPDPGTGHHRWNKQAVVDHIPAPCLTSVRPCLLRRMMFVSLLCRVMEKHRGSPRSQDWWYCYQSTSQSHQCHLKEECQRQTSPSRWQSARCGWTGSWIHTESPRLLSRFPCPDPWYYLDESK